MSESLAPNPVLVDTDEDRAALIALAGLPGLSPQRFWSLLALGTPHQVWGRVAAGGAPRSNRQRDAASAWPRWARSVEPEAELHRHDQAGIVVLPYGHRGYPDALLDDPEPQR